MTQKIKHRYTIRWTYANGKTENVKLSVRNLDDAIKYVNAINSQSSMKAEILKDRKVLWTY